MGGDGQKQYSRRAQSIMADTHRGDLERQERGTNGTKEQGRQHYKANEYEISKDAGFYSSGTLVRSLDYSATRAIADSDPYQTIQSPKRIICVCFRFSSKHEASSSVAIRT